MTTQLDKPSGRGGNRNPTGKGGFQERPQDISPGGWDKTQSISYQYNKLMRLNPKDLTEFKPETVAQQIALARVKAALDQKLGLPDSKEITDRTEGRAPQYIGLGDPSDAKKALVEFIYGTDSTNGNNTNTG